MIFPFTMGGSPFWCHTRFRTIAGGRKLYFQMARLALLRPLVQLPCLLQIGEHFAEAVEASSQVFDDLFGKVVGLGQVVQVRQALVLEPEYVGAGLVAGRQFFAVVTTPTALEQVLLRFKRPVFASR